MGVGVCVWVGVCACVWVSSPAGQYGAGGASVCANCAAGYACPAGSTSPNATTTGICLLSRRPTPEARLAFAIVCVTKGFVRVGCSRVSMTLLCSVCRWQLQQRGGPRVLRLQHAAGVRVSQHRNDHRHWCAVSRWKVQRWRCRHVLLLGVQVRRCSWGTGNVLCLAMFSYSFGPVMRSSD